MTISTRKNIRHPLIWVKPELDETIRSIHGLLETYTDNLDNDAALREINANLHLIRGSLEMLEFYAVALLVESMQTAIHALLAKSIDKKEDVFESILQATLSLEAYIEKLHKDQNDLPLSLLPVMNDIRAAISEPLLSESALFQPNLSIVPKTPGDIPENYDESCLSESAKSLRPYYQAALLTWFRDPSDQLSMQQMKLVARNLESSSLTPRNRQIWWILGGLYEALSEKGLNANISIKLILGQADRVLKSLSQDNKEIYEKAPPIDLLKNALYYISQATSSGERVKTLKHVYKLSEVIPSDRDISTFRKDLNSPSSESLQAIAKELKKSLDQVKAVIDNFARNSPENTSKLNQTIIPLKHIADTMSLLSLGNEKKLLQSLIKDISNIISSDTPPKKETMLQIAATMLHAESALKSIGAIKRKPRSTVEANDDLISGDHMISTKNGKLPEAEYRLLVIKTAEEAKNNIAEVKNNVLSYLSSNSEESELIKPIPKLISEINGSMVMLENKYLPSILAPLKEYVRKDFLNPNRPPKKDEYDTFAEALVSIEYYLESIVEERRPSTSILHITCDNLTKLGYPTILPKQANKNMPALEAVVTHINEAPARFRPHGVDEYSKKQDTDAKSNNVLAFATEEPDPEVKEIFVEEAFEELSNMESQIKSLKLNPNDTDTLSSLRRIFHTLKGSGKIAGATEVSNLATAADEYLAKVLCKAINIDKNGVTLLEESQQILFSIIDLYQNNKPSSVDANNFIKKLDAYIASIQTSSNSKSDKPQTSVNESQNKAEFASRESNDTKAIDEIEAKPKDLSVEIENNENLAQIELIESFIHRQLQSNAIISITDDLKSAISKLAESAEKAGNKEFTQTIELLSKYIGNIAKKNAPVNQETLDILDEFCTTTREILADLSNENNLDSQDSEVTTSKENSQLESDILETLSINDSSQNGTTDFSNPAADIESLLSEPINTDEVSSLPTEIEETEFKEEIHSLESLNENAPKELLEDTNPPDEEFELNNDDNIDLIDIFMEEALELIEKGNQIISDSEQVDDAFLTSIQRLLHTMKGSARMAGVTSVGNIAHLLESVFEASISNEIQTPAILSDLTQETLDAISDMVDDIQSGADLRTHNELLIKLESIISHSEPSAPEETSDDKINDVIIKADESATNNLNETASSKSSSNDTSLKDENNNTNNLDLQVLDISATEPDNDQLSITETTDEHFIEENKALDSHSEIPSAIAQSSSSDSTENSGINQSIILSENENTLDTITTLISNESDKSKDDEITSTPEPTTQNSAIENLPTTKSESTTKSIAPMKPTKPIGSTDAIKVDASVLDKLVDFATEESAISSRIGDHVATSKTTLFELDNAITRTLMQMRDLQFESNISRSESQKESGDKLNLSSFTESQKVAQRLMESIGDIENLHSVLTKITLETDNLAHQQRKIHHQLHESLLDTRMVTFSIQTQRMQRIVRQTCSELHKKAKLVLEGTDGSIDRAILDTAMGPMEHIIRNAIAHGIEFPTERKEHKKHDTGTVNISFSKDKTEHLIVIKDDGAGLNLKAIEKKGIEKGLISKNKAYSSDDVASLIFEPGFSTSDQVSQISGRGVGMDVAINTINNLGGSISVSTEENKGTEFTIRLPFTLSRNHTLIVKAGKNTYAIPSSAIEHSFSASQTDLAKLYEANQPSCDYDNKDYPLWYINTLLNDSPTCLPAKNGIAHIILLKYGNKRLALHVDQVEDTRDTVLKPNSPQLNNVAGIAGVTVMGDGKVVLIVDIPVLLKLSQSGEHQHREFQSLDELNTKSEQIKTLIVDDSITVRKVTERFLNRNGITSLTAKDGVEALEILENETPDIMLLDIEMPNMDGLELATKIKSDKRLQDIPIIMITSRTGKHHRHAAGEIGVEVFLGKPYQESELIGYIQALTGKRISQ